MELRRIHILANDMRAQNSRGFLFPILHNADRLRDAGLVVRVFRAPAERISECDALLVDGKALDPRSSEPIEAVASLLDRWRNTCPVAYFDLSDSAAWLRTDALPHVTLYFKNQIARDRSAFGTPLYGLRQYTDYYHRTDGVKDDVPEMSTPVTDKVALSRIRVAWNAGLSNYAIYGPRLAVIADRLRIAPLLFYPRRFTSPRRNRPVPVSLRMGASYRRRTVAHQRQTTLALLSRYAPTGRVSKIQYFRELRSARVVSSPFGWGEINQKDFECFLSGAALLKPDMAHLETWPNWFTPGETCATHAWDLHDLEDTVENLLGDDGLRTRIAESGQERYRHYIGTESGHEEFVDRFAGVVSATRAQWQKDRTSVSPRALRVTG